MEIEIKLLKNNMEEKASIEELEKTNAKVARVFNNTDNIIKKLTGNLFLIIFAIKQNVYDFR